VTTKRIFTSPDVDPSRFSPALKHACTLPWAGRRVLNTSFGVIWWDASQGSSLPATGMSPLAAAALAAGAGVAGGLESAAAGGESAAVLGAAAESAALGLPEAEAVSSSSFAFGVPPPQPNPRRGAV